MNSLPVNDVAHAAVRAQFTRRLVPRLRVAAIALALGHSRVTRAITARCHKKSDRCDNSTQCCSGRCRCGFCCPRR